MMQFGWLCIALFLGAAASPSVSAAPVQFAGDWTGTLTYRDFTSGRAVVLPATLAVMPADAAYRFSYAYDDGPGKVVRDVETVALDPAAGIYRVRGKYDDTYRGDVAAFARRGLGRLVLSGGGDENGVAVEVRETIDLDRAALVMRREVKRPGGAFFTRSIYRFTRVLPPDALRADAAILRRAYEALHPGLYRYETPQQTAANFAELDASLSAPATIPQAYLAFARFTAAVRCGHSYPNFFNQPDAIAEAVFGGTNRLPFTFAWLHGRMIVTKNLSGNPALEPGADVTAIDGRPASTILARLMTFARADGSNDAKRVDQLQLTGDERYEAFDVYYPLAFPTTSTTIALRVRPFGGSEANDVTVDAQTDADRDALVAARNARAAGGGDIPLWSVRTLKPGIAYLQMPTWVTYNSKWDWKGFLADTFSALAARGTPNLVIDLRGNEGGTDVGSEIVAHLIDRSLETIPVRSLVRYRAIPAALAPYLDTWDPTFKDWGAEAEPFDNRFFRLVRAGDGAGADRIAPQAPRYRGRVWVLVDASNSSATFTFDELVRRRRLATLVGSPAGGNQRGSNGGAFFFVRLPNTGIEIDLPLIGAFAIDSAPDAGIVPDVIAEPTQSDVATGRDAALDAVLSRAGAP